MAKSIVTVASRVYAPGTRSILLPNLTADDNGVKISLTREGWPDTGADVVAAIILGSDDGGATWYELMRFSYVGGVMTNPRTGQVVSVCGPTVFWPQRNDGSGNFILQRPGQARADVTNFASLRTAITLEGA